MHKYFSPNFFKKIINIIFPFTIISSVVFFGLGLYFALFASPPDYQQGESVRIMYVHVPSAWMSLGVYLMIGISSIAFIIWKNPLSVLIARCSAPIGVIFTLICLITGSLWGKPIWGTWWVWDARLTSMLILLFFYIAYISLYNAFDDDRQKAGQMSSLLAILGLINVPIVKFSVDWWNTLHQPASIIRSGGVSIDQSMLLPLMLVFAGYVSFYLMVFIILIKTELLKIKR